MLADNLYIHKKTGHLYAVIQTDMIECTNGREEKKYIAYCNVTNGRPSIFCREQDEFYQKFIKYECHK